MSRLVTSDELDVLLAPDEGAETVTPYDFRRPDRVTKDQLRALHLLHDRFAHTLATSLSAFLRATTDVQLVSVDQQAYGEFLDALADPTAFYALAMPPLDRFAALELSPGIAFTMVDRMLGGRGEHAGAERPLTEIEQHVVDTVVKLIVDHLSEVWKSVGALQFRIHARDTRPQMLKVTSATEPVVVVTCAIAMAEANGTLRLSMPLAAFDATGASFSQAWPPSGRPLTAEEAAHLAVHLGRVPLAVSAQLATRLSARELVALRPGDVLNLGHHSGAPVTVSVGDADAFEGQLVVVNGSLAVRVDAEAGDTTSGTGA